MSEETNGSIVRVRRRRWLWIALGLAAVVGGGVIWLQTALRAPPLPPLPEPNGYDVLVQASRLIGGDAPDFRTATPDVLRTYLDGNAEALVEIRHAIVLDSRVPVRFSRDYIAASIKEIETLRQSARLIMAEAKLARMEARSADAYRANLALVKHAHRLSHGGLFIHYLSAAAYANAATQELRDLIPRLSAEQCEELAATAIELDRQHEPFDDLARRESQLQRQTAGLAGALALVFQRTTVAKVFDQTKQSYDRAAAQLRLLAVHAAIRCFELANDRLPDSLEELAPVILAQVPSDPYSGKSMSYRKQDESYRLVCVGPDGIDDEQKPPNATSSDDVALISSARRLQPGSESQ